MRALRLYKDGRERVKIVMYVPTGMWNQWVTSVAMCAYARWFRPSGRYPKTRGFVRFLMEEMYYTHYMKWLMKVKRKYGEKVDVAMDMAIEKGLVVVVDENYVQTRQPENAAQMAEIRHRPQWDMDADDPMDDED